MTAMSVNISTRKFNEGVTYNPFEKMTIYPKEERVTFLAETLLKEVMQGTEEQRRKRIKKLKKIYTKFVSVLGASVMMAPKAFAAEGTTKAVLLGTGTITPAVVMKWGLTLALLTVSAGVALSGSLLAIAGIYRMFRKRDAAEEWTTDIIKGLVQVLIAVPTVYVLFYLAQFVFKNLPMLGGLF